MNHENLILTRVAITMAPRLNNALFASLFQECGGISGFFEETEQNIKTLFRKNNLPNMQPERSRWLQMGQPIIGMSLFYYYFSAFNFPSLKGT